MMDLWEAQQQLKRPDTRTGKIRALQESAALFSFLQANGIQSMQQLHEKIADLNSCYYDLRGNIVKACLLYTSNRSIRENIRMGRPSATDAEVEQAAKQSGCDAFIRKLDNGYDTVCLLYTSAFGNIDANAVHSHSSNTKNLQPEIHLFSLPIQSIG